MWTKRSAHADASRPATGPWAALAAAGAVVTIVAAAVVVLPPAARAQIGPVNPLDPAEGFGVVTEQDAVLTGAENEGTIAVGGDLQFAGTYQLNGRGEATYVAPGDDTPTALIVDGSIDFAEIPDGSVLQVLGGAYVKIGDLSNAFVRNTDDNGATRDTRILPVPDDFDATPRVELTVTQPVASVGAPSGYDFETAFAEFRSTSAALAQCTNTVTLTNANGEPWTGEPSAYVSLTSGETNVLNIDAEDLDTIDNLTFRDTPTQDTPLLVNVDTSGVGGEFSWSPPNFAGIGPQEGQYILFNFPDATEVLLREGGAGTIGALYAPNADIIDRTGSDIDGSIVAQSFDQDSGEVHPELFDAELECDAVPPSPTPPPPTPPPTTPAPTAPPTTPAPTAPPTTPAPTAPPTPVPTAPTVSPVPTLPPTGSAAGAFGWWGGGAVLLGVALLALYRVWRPAARHR